MTRNEILRRFPNAVESFIRANLGESSTELVPAPKRVLSVFAQERPKLTTDELGLNKTERRFYEGLKRGLCAFSGTMNWDCIHVQAVTLKLADDCRLTVDFVCVDQVGHEDFIDVKGFQREDALIKMKVAARMFPHKTFWIVKRDVKQPTGWNWKRIKS